MSSAQLSSCLYLAEPPNGGRHSDRVPTAVAAGGGGVSIAENCEMDLKKMGNEVQEKTKELESLDKGETKTGRAYRGRTVYLFYIFKVIYGYCTWSS